MDQVFESAIATVLQHEGGYVDHADDPGGATNYGISLRFLKSLKRAEGDIDLSGEVNAHDIRALTVEGAKRLYWVHWWKRFGYGRLPSSVGAKVLDLSIWMGPGRAHRLLQQALWAAGQPVNVDGMIGPKTRAAVTSVEAEQLVVGLRSEAAGFVRCLVARRPASKTFLRGWVRRAYS